jgi:predicted HicB family RNase H-like nuclease
MAHAKTTPLEFDINSPVANSPIAANTEPPRKEAKTQLGARVSEARYRQLKVAAVLRGVTVQGLVEQAIDEFLTNHPDLLKGA